MKKTKIPVEIMFFIFWALVIVILILVKFFDFV